VSPIPRQGLLADRRDAGSEQRDEHVPEHPQRARAEHARRRFEVGIDLLDEWRHHQDDERRGRDQIGEDHAPDRPGELHFVKDRRERNAVGDRRHHERQQEQEHERALADEIAARERICGGHADQEREEHDGEHDFDRDPQHRA